MCLINVLVGGINVLGAHTAHVHTKYGKLVFHTSMYIVRLISVLGRLLGILEYGCLFIPESSLSFKVIITLDTFPFFINVYGDQLSQPVETI